MSSRRCSEKNGWMSSHFGSIVAVLPPAGNNRFSGRGCWDHGIKRTLRGKQSISGNTGVGQHWRHTVVWRAGSIRVYKKRQDPGQARPRTDEEPQVDQSHHETRETNAAETPVQTVARAHPQ